VEALDDPGDVATEPFLSEAVLSSSRRWAIQMELRACRTFSSCPVCVTSSHRVHSRYSCHLGDLRGDEMRVLSLLIRRLCCINWTAV
jgi:hypothetical protein